MSEQHYELHPDIRKDDDLCECPCGYVFPLIIAQNLRAFGGRYFNDDVRQSALDAPHQVQCPKCLLWFNPNDYE